MIAAQLGQNLPVPLAGYHAAEALGVLHLMHYAHDLSMPHKRETKSTYDNQHIDYILGEICLFSER